MHWVIQDNLFREHDRDDRNILIEFLKKMQISYQLVNIAPSSHELNPEVIETENVITNGSILLSRIARERGWNPGSFLNDNFDYRMWYPYFKEFLLNKDAVFSTVAEAAPQFKNVFVRPVLDSKTFDGQVMTQTAFAVWKENILRGENKYVLPETEIICAPSKPIGQEHRHFIVDGKVITSSRYKLNGLLNQEAGADAYIVEFATRMATIFSPARAFVLDTYVTGDDVGIVELGCACNAGFYKADVQKLVMALEYGNN